MNNAYSITVEDVENVLLSNTILVDLGSHSLIEFSELMLDKLNLDDVELAALFGNDMDEQNDYAHDSITDQLVALGVITIGETKRVAAK